MALGIAFRTEMLDGKRDSLSTTETTAESLVAIALDATEFKVTMQGFHFEAQFAKSQQQADAVCPAGKGYQKACA